MSDLLQKQLAFAPEVIGQVPAFDGVMCGGMGGSALPALLFQRSYPEKSIRIHRDHGLPQSVPPQTLFVAISYSGDTEETLSFARAVLERNLPLGVIASGGELLSLAQEKNLPHVIVPGGFEPRDAIVAMTKALAALAGAPELMHELNASGDASSARARAEELAKHLKNSIPLFYASERNNALAYVCKITFNETAKVPAFSNTFPELGHNEMQGLDSKGPAELAKRCSIVIVRDAEDGEHMAAHMKLFAEIMASRGANILSVDLPGRSGAENAVWIWEYAREAARMLAEEYGVPPDEVPLIQEFKRRLR